MVEDYVGSGVESKLDLLSVIKQLSVGKEIIFRVTAEEDFSVESVF